MRTALLWLVVILLTSHLALADYERGEIAYGLGDYETAAREYRAAAEQGHAQAALSLGGLYAYGDGVTKDEREALRWYHRAADLGSKNAYLVLGVAHESGAGTPRNHGKAFEWYLRGAEAGDAGAQTFVAEMYEDGRGVPRDLMKAYVWHSLASANGSEFSRSALNRLERQLSRPQVDEAQRIASELHAEHQAR